MNFPLSRSLQKLLSIDCTIAHQILKQNRFDCSLIHVCVAENAKCPGNQFQCKSGQCLKMSARCNRKVDCDDKSDELNCFNGYLTRKIRGSLRISNPLSVHSRRSIKHTKKALIAGKHKPKQNQWELHSSQCRSVSSTSYFKFFNNFFSNLAGDTTQNKFNPTIASFSSASVPTHWSFILLLATCIVTASCPAAHTNSTKFCPLFIFNCLAKPQKGDILHAQMVQYLHAPNHTSP